MTTVGLARIAACSFRAHTPGIGSRHTRPGVIVIIAALLMLGAQSAFGQLRIVGRISGTIEDQAGALVPKAKVVLKDEKTGITKEIVSSSEGTFLFPDLATGLYELTVTAQGFQTAALSDITVSTNQTTDVKVLLLVGQMTETVQVAGDVGARLETSSQLIASTLETKTITELPVANRGNVLALARLAPGAAPATGGSTRYNNLAGGAVNVTVDGINDASNGFKSSPTGEKIADRDVDGINDASNGFKSGGTVFFMTVPVRLGAVDELTVETTGLSADSGAQSGANIKFTTRRGGNHYHGSAFWEPQSERFNANTWSRNAQGLPRVFNRTQNYGGNFGGPLIPYGSFKKKMFFFVNFERAYSPLFVARSVSIFTDAALRGDFTYVVSGTTNQLRTANVLQLAAAKGLPIKLDSVVQSILAVNSQVPKNASKIASTDLNRDVYTWNAENNNYAYFPTTRFDYWVTPKQQVTFTWNYRHNWQAGERRLPVPDINRTNPFRLGYFVWSAALQSTFSPRMFNELRYGVQHSGDTNTRAEYGPYYQFNGTPLRIGAGLPFSVAETAAAPGPRVPFIDQQNVTGRHFITTMYDTLTLSRGEHAFMFGGSYRKTVWNDSAEVFPVPTYGTGTPAGDPLNASSAFTLQLLCPGSTAPSWATHWRFTTR